MAFDLGDIVTLPLPTQWSPDVQAQRQAGAGTPGGTLLPAPVSGPVPQGALYTPQPILPDALLPAALQRDWLQKSIQPQFQPNKWDFSILAESWLWEWIAEHGGLLSCCRIPELGAPVYNNPPWMVMPSQGVEYRYMFSQPTNAISGGGPYDGTDTLLGSFRVPIGYDGLLNQFVVQFTGDGFTDFSGAIAWRVRIDARYAKNLGNVQNTYGSFQSGLLVPGYGIRLVSGQTVSVYASIPADSPVTGGVVAAGLFGWNYPRR